MREAAGASLLLFNRTWRLLDPKGRWLFTCHIAAFLAAIGVDVLLPFLFAWMIEAASTQNDRVYLYAVLLALGWFVVRALEDAKLVLYIAFEQVFQRQIYQEFLDRFTRLPLDYLEKMPPAAHNIVVDRGVDGIRTVIHTSFFGFLPLILRVSFLVVVIAIQVDGWLALALVGAVVGFLSATITIGGTINALTVRYLETFRDFFAMAQESLANATSIRTYSAFRWAKKRLNAVLDVFIAQVSKTFRPMLLLGVIQGGYIGFIFLIVNFVILKGHENTADAVPLLVLANGLTIQLSQPLLGFSYSFGNWLRGISNTTLVMDLLSQKDFLPVVKHSTHFGDSIAIEGLIVRYGDKVVIDKLSASIPLSGVTALMGPSGSGKSSLAKALAGLKQYSGKILVPEAIKTFRYASQNPEVFNDTLNANVALSDPSPSPADMSDYLRRAGLSHEEVSKFAEMLGDGGSKLSGGQRSRVGLARAIFSECDVLVLDEPTAALDEDNAQRVMDTIFEIAETGDIKVILVTHDTRIADRCSQVITL